MKTNVIATILIAASTSLTAMAQSLVYFTSSPGSWVGQGQTMTFSPTNGNPILVLSETGFVNVLIDGGFWDLELGTPDGSAFAVGLYPYSVIFGGDGRGDDFATGWFDVLEVTQTGGVINPMAADFVYYDEGLTNNWVRGSFRYNSDVPVPLQWIFLECTNGFATGTVNTVVQDSSGNAVQLVWTVDGVPAQTNNIPPGGALTATNLTFTASFSDGEHIVVASASNGQTPPTTSTTSVSVLDTTPPEIMGIAATPNVLWPANHQMVPVNVTVNATDSCDSSTTAQITQVISSEPQGHFAPDWTITGPMSLNLRAERSGNSNRVYTIYVDVADSSGNTSTTTTTVTVPSSLSILH